jgi:hypothetical protein
MERPELEGKSREELIALAERLGVSRPRVLTQHELIDEIVKRTTTTARDRARARGWLGRARDLLASVVERGLHLPEAANLLRSSPDERSWPVPPPPLPTVTLAEIYAAQGHLDRAVAVLGEVLAREPDHHEARRLRERFAEQQGGAQQAKARSARPVAPVEEVPPVAVETPAAPVEETPPAAVETPVAPAAPVEETPPAAVETPAAPPAPVEETPAAPPAVSAPLPEPAAPAVTPESITPQVLSAAPPSPVPVAPPAAVAPVPAAPSPVPQTPLPAAPAAPVASPGPSAGAPLPERYDVDEVVGIAVDPHTIYLYWEVRPTSLAHAHAKWPGGYLALRIASVAASWNGPVTRTQDVRVDELYGDRFIHDLEPGSNVRVSVGWLVPGAVGSLPFEPFAVGDEVTAPRATPAEPASQLVARWTPEGIRPAARRPSQPPSSGTAPVGRIETTYSPGSRLSGPRAGLELRPLLLPEEVRRAPANQTRPGEATPGGARSETVVQETVWIQRVGSSELTRETRTTVLSTVGPGPGGLGPGGASELARVPARRTG